MFTAAAPFSIVLLKSLTRCIRSWMAAVNCSSPSRIGLKLRLISTVLAGMSSGEYHRQAAWGALISVAFFAALALIAWPWTRWALAAALFYGLLKPCVRMIRR